MKSGKVIDVSKSSLVSLKAELLRKQEEAQKSKASESYVRPVPKVKKEPKKNKGVDERNEKDQSITEEEIDALKKSKEVLEIKAKLYDKLQKGDVSEISENYLVDFKEKTQDDELKKKSDDSGCGRDKEEVLSSEDDFSDDDDWTEYVDCLGRTRRCLKEDLPSIKARDRQLADRLTVCEAPSTSKSNTSAEPPPQEPSSSSAPPELVSADMQREEMRLKWEQQELELAEKKNVYYEDVRFDEARTHGVAYYALSTDETKREEQMAEIKRVREQTEAKQREVAAVKQRRELAKQARLIAARKRQRARLGLSPIEVEEELLTNPSSSDDIPGHEQDQPEAIKVKEESVEDELKRAAHVRPWDIGKEGVNQPNPVMSQEEWMEKRRDERMDEFAPPLQYRREGVKEKKTERNLGGGKRYESTSEETEDSPPPGPELPPGWIGPDLTKPPPLIRKPSVFGLSAAKRARSSVGATDYPVESPSSSTDVPKRGVEIAPPISFSFYTPEARRKAAEKRQLTNRNEMMASIEAGLQFIRDQNEIREKQIGKK